MRSLTLLKQLINGSLQKRIDTLEANEKHLEAVMKNLAASVVVKNTKGVILFCSPYTEVLTGYPLQEIYNPESDFFLSLIHEEDHEQYLRALKVSASGEPYRYRYRFFHRSGIEMWAETRTTPLFNESDEIASFLSITFDVTGTVRYQKQVEEQSKEIHDFTYMVSHDLKAPLFTIKGMLAVINEDCREVLPEKVLEPLAFIEKATIRLENLITSVLSYAKVTSTGVQAVPVDLTQVINEAISDIHTKIAVLGGSVILEDTFPTVLAEKVKAYQVFSNLLTNAIKFASPERPPQIRISPRSTPSKRHLLVEVKDNGLGIPKDKIMHLFRPFQRFHGDDIEGTGVGLVSVKRLMEKFGGDVSVESEEGSGTTFILRFRLG